VRIAHVITRMILGGAQENTLFTCEDLRERHGDEVLLVTGPPLGPEGSLLDRARSRGVPLAIIDPMRRAIHPVRDPLAYRQLKRVLREFQPDIVHTHSAKAGILGRMAGRALNVPGIVHGVHGAPFHPYQNRFSRALFRACEKWAAPKCDAYISVCDAMTDLLVKAGVDRREKFHTVYSGMEVEPFLTSDPHRARVRAELGYDDSHVVIGKIARLFHLKGHEYVIRAASEVVARCPQAQFLFIGNGILRNELGQQIQAAGLTEHFKFTGLVPPQRIPELLAAMDIVVHTSLREGLPRALAQGALSAKPIVSFDIDGAREVCIDGVTGRLLEPKDTTGLAQALIELCSDPDLRHRLGHTGRARFADTFRHETATARQRALYEQLLA
jgi:glycosyltransferase involved in cell wall biosynthesis